MQQEKDHQIRGPRTDAKQTSGVKNKLVKKGTKAGQKGDKIALSRAMQIANFKMQSANLRGLTAVGESYGSSDGRAVFFSNPQITQMAPDIWGEKTTQKLPVAFHYR